MACFYEWIGNIILFGWFPIPFSWFSARTWCLVVGLITAVDTALFTFVTIQILCPEKLPEKLSAD